MSKGLTRQERLIRIELARTRAALERQNVTRTLHDLQDSFTPAGLWQSLFSGGGARRMSRRYASGLGQILALTRRYPFLLTSVSAVISSVGRGRKGWAWRIGLGALAGWKVLQSLQRRASPPDDQRAVTHRPPV